MKPDNQTKQREPSPKILYGAVRQYRHNTDTDGSGGFVIAYDRDETEKVVLELLRKLAEVEGQLHLQTVAAVNYKHCSKKNEQLKKEAEAKIEAVQDWIARREDESGYWAYSDQINELRAITGVALKNLT